MPKLHILSPGSLAATIELTDNLITIGRTPENSICIQDTNISRRHGILVRDGDNYQLHDFKSANGTFVNGEPIMAVKLKDGASIRFGPVELRYESGLAKVAPLGVAQVAPLAVAQADQGMISTPHKGSSAKGRGGMSKRMKPEYAAGALMAGPATIQPGSTAKPIPPPSPKTSE
jgi:pSer/pThr/pTyr-binding forkhead associated (FHA) protein